jgi:hypothetical protein
MQKDRAYYIARKNIKIDTRSTCSECGRRYLDGVRLRRYHENYDNPLDAKILCDICYNKKSCQDCEIEGEPFICGDEI